LYYIETSKLHLNSSIVPLNIVSNAADKKTNRNAIEQCKNLWTIYDTVMDHFYKH